MLTKDTEISALPSHYKLVAYCYSCDQTNHINLAENADKTIQELSDTLNCPVCLSDHLGIRPVIEPQKTSMNNFFSTIKTFLKKKVAI